MLTESSNNIRIYVYVYLPIIRRSEYYILLCIRIYNAQGRPVRQPFHDELQLSGGKRDYVYACPSIDTSSSCVCEYPLRCYAYMYVIGRYLSLFYTICSVLFIFHYILHKGISQFHWNRIRHFFTPLYYAARIKNNKLISATTTDDHHMILYYTLRALQDLYSIYFVLFYTITKLVLLFVLIF